MKMITFFCLFVAISSTADEQIEKLKNETIVKYRIYKSDSYIEDDMKKKNSDKIKRALNLVF